MASFRYLCDAVELKSYLQEQGYVTEEVYSQDGKTPKGFKIVDTYIEVSYAHLFTHPVTGDTLTATEGHVSLPAVTFVQDSTRGPGWWRANDSVISQESKRLYKRLYRRFRRPPYERVS